MNFQQTIQNLLKHEELNFLLTNRLPRNTLTRFMGWFSKIEQPLVRDASIAVWRFFSGLDVSEARKTQFTSLHDCFIRELKADARPVNADPAALASPCDGIIGAHGPIEGKRIFQAKGFPYALEDLLGDETKGHAWRDGYFVTLRLTSSMYHRFHAPHDLHVEQLTYFSGDTWNVNPIALKRVEKLFCKNERAFIASWATARARASLWRWCRWRQYWWRASGCIFWTCCCILNIAGRATSRVTPYSARGRRWAGFSTAPPSLCWHPRAFRCARLCAKAP